MSAGGISSNVTLLEVAWDEGWEGRDARAVDLRGAMAVDGIVLASGRSSNV